MSVPQSVIIFKWGYYKSIILYSDFQIYGLDHIHSFGDGKNLQD